jgi:NADPH2:quinone reductase
MTHAIVVSRHGGPDVLSWQPFAVGEPGPGEVRLRQTAVGVNFIDVYFRTGLYAADPPFVPGLEGAGVVETVGPGVDDLRAGDRVAYASRPMGAYAEARLMPAERLVKLPSSVGDQQAAAMMLKGMTAEYLLLRTFEVRPGTWILIHAAAGGLGLIVCQWARHLGARVIGTVSNEEKAELAVAHGCEFPILYTREDFVARTREITGGEGVHVVYDSVGQDTFLRSLDCVRPLGMVVSLGQSSGAVERFDPGLLQAKGSLFVTRPSLFHYIARRDDLRASAAALFDVVGRGIVRSAPSQVLPLREAAEAHRALEARATTGATVLTV